MTFKECSACSAKPGSPTLCAGCLHNRSVITTLMLERDNARQCIPQLDAEIARLAAERDRLQRMLDVGEKLRADLSRELHDERDRSSSVRKHLDAIVHDAANVEAQLRGIIARVGVIHDERAGSSK